MGKNSKGHRKIKNLKDFDQNAGIGRTTSLEPCVDGSRLVHHNYFENICAKVWNSNVYSENLYGQNF
jgi:hypothetical protein